MYMHTYIVDIHLSYKIKEVPCLITIQSFCGETTVTWVMIYMEGIHCLNHLTPLSQQYRQD